MVVDGVPVVVETVVIDGELGSFLVDDGIISFSVVVIVVVVVTLSIVLGLIVLDAVVTALLMLLDVVLIVMGGRTDVSGIVASVSTILTDLSVASSEVVVDRRVRDVFGARA